MDAITKKLVDEGMTADQAADHLRKIAQAKQAADEGLESFRKIAAAVVDERLAAQANKNINPSAEGEEVVVPKELVGDIWLMGQMLKKHPKELDPLVIQKGYAARAKDPREYSLAVIKAALNTSDNSTLVPTVMVQTLYRDIEKEAPAIANFRVVDMPANPWEMPYQSAGMTIYGVDESTTDSAAVVAASTISQSAITFNAKKLGARIFWSREILEDSVIAIMPMIQEDLVRITRNGWEYNFIMGDELTNTSNINNYGGAVTTTAGAKDPFLQVDGLVKSCITTHTGQSTSGSAAAITTPLFHAVRTKLGKYGVNPNDVIAFMPRDLWYDMLKISEVLTMDKYQAGATIAVGELSKLFGISLVVTDGMPLTYTDGRVSTTGGNNTKKSLLMANKTYGVIIGRRGEMRVAQQDVIDTDQTKAVVFSRYDIQIPFYGAVAYGYNYL